ncbi:MAG: LptF/LptG family permease [Lentisphaeria bacterium]|nr:LptF/LptG family permease [Lentisphaeria bacterium]
MEQQKTIQSTARRTFLWMPKLDLYVVREFMIPFSVLIFAFSLLFLIGDVFNDVDKFIEKENATAAAIRYFMLKMPGNLLFVMPITVLLSCMYTLANMGRRLEITAMRASGISLFRCSVPIFVIAFLVMLLNFWFSEAIVPKCAMETVRIMRSIGEDGSDSAYRNNKSVQYQTADNMRSWMFGSFTEDSSQYNVRLKFFREEKAADGSIQRVQDRVLNAKKAEYIDGKGWKFYECTEKTVLQENGLFNLPKQHDVLFVSSDDIPETPEMIETAITNPDMLSSLEIYHFLKQNPDLPKPIRALYQTYLYRHLAFPWACFLCAFLALPLAAKNQRSGIFTSIMSAVGVIVAYQILSDVFIMLGKSGQIPPVIAGLLPTVAFAAYGIILARKAG